MISLFSTEGLSRLDVIARPGLLCAFDFDGTLAPIVSQPDMARLPADVLDRLVKLSTLAPVAIITGRGIDDIRPRLGFDADFLIGNHGLEGLPGWEQRAAHYGTLGQAWGTQLAALLEHEPIEGVWIENKRLSLSVHFRLAPNPVAAEAQLASLFAQLDPPPRTVAGKFVYNLMPDDACDKGGALERLMALTGAGAALYVGDDVTDEDVFHLRRDDVTGIRVESSPDSAAGWFIDRRSDIVQLLDALIDRLRAAHSSNWVRPKPASNG